MYRWDKNKRLANIAKHGVDFRDIERFEWETAIFREPDFVDHEVRENAIGWIDDKLCAVTYTERDEFVRIISLRVASNYERKIWNGE